MRPYADRGSSVSLSIVFGVDGQNYEKEMVMSAMLQKKRTQQFSCQLVHTGWRH